MTCPQHGRELLLLTLFFRWFGGKRTDFLASRIGQCSVPGPFSRLYTRNLGVGILDSSDSQCRIDSACAITAPRKRLGATLGEQAIVDITPLRKARDDRLMRRLALSCPAAFAQLAFEIAP